jgi:hypothetical protein
MWGISGLEEDLLDYLGELCSMEFVSSVISAWWEYFPKICCDEGTLANM